MSHRITAMLELYGGRVIGQLNLFHDKEGKSPEAGTGTTVRSYWSFLFFFLIRKTEFSILFVCLVLQFNRVGTLLMVDYSFSHPSIISSSRLLSYAPGHWINRPCLKPPHCVSHCVLLFPPSTSGLARSDVTWCTGTGWDPFGTAAADGCDYCWQ